MRLIPLALTAHEAALASADRFDWHPDPDLRPESSGDAEAELRVVHEVWGPSSYCSTGDSTGTPA